MRRLSVLFLLVVAMGATSAGSAGATSRPKADRNTYCPQPPATEYIGRVTAPYNLIVPPGTSCGPTQGSTVGHDVIVSRGASFLPGGTTIGHSVYAYKADLIELGDPNNGTTDTTVGHDVVVVGTQGNLGYGQFICQTRIGHDLVIADTAASVSQWWIGFQDAANCARNYGRGGDTIGHDAFVFDNADSVYMGDNEPEFNGGTGSGIGHTLFFFDNHGAQNVLADNTIGHDCRQFDNHPFDGFGNVAGHDVHGCNS